MPRALTTDLDIIQTSPSGRRPGFKVEIYDVRSSGDTIGDIVRGLTLEALTGPRDFTADTISVSIEEKAGDFVESGISGSSVSLSIIDPNDQFDPFNVIANPTGNGRWLRRGNVVRIYEGDERVPKADWPITFTGVLQGQAGNLFSRDPNASPKIVVMQAVDRSAGFLRYPKNSDSFAIGATYLSMATAIATNDMGLDADEISFTGWGAQVTGQPFQMVEDPPLFHIAQLMMPSGFLPIFTGEGKLTQTQPLLIASPDRAYTDDGLFIAINRPFNQISPANRVVVVGLEKFLSKAVQPRQQLVEASLTTGYFTQGETLEVYWSEDRTLLAENIAGKVDKSINGGLSVLGGSEDFQDIGSPGGQEGTIGSRLEIESGFAPWLLVFLLVTYLVLSWIPDEVVTALVAGFTINVGSAAAAAALAAALLVMTKIGRGVYRWFGDPFEYVLKEIREIAERDDILTADRIQVLIENHAINSVTDARNLARDVLFEQHARAQPRQITMIHDLKLVPHDVFERPGNRFYLVEKISRTLQRGQPVIAQVDTFETTSGLDP